VPPRIEQATAAPGEYRQLDPEDPAPELVKDLALYLGCSELEATHRLIDMRGPRGR
jgi:hypothetical protein